jgi:hypothetical protein
MARSICWRVNDPVYFESRTIRSVFVGAFVLKQ